MHLNVGGVSVWVGKIHHSTSRHTGIITLFLIMMTDAVIQLLKQ